MAFVGATLFIVIIGIAVIYRLTAYFGFRLKLSALVLCALLAFVVNITAIMLSPYLTEQHYIRLGVLATVAAALVTIYNEFLLMREEKAAQDIVLALPLTDEERAVIAPTAGASTTEAATTADSAAKLIEAPLSVNPSSPIERLKAMRKKAFARREKVEKIREQNAVFLEKSRMDDLAKRREEEKRRLEEERRRREESEKRAREQREEQERRKKEQEAERKRREEEEKRLKELREQAMKAERERLQREEEEKRQRELENERRIAEENRRREEAERRERERRLRELEEEQKRLEEEKQKREAAAKLRRVKTLDELLDEAVTAKGKGDRPGAVTALSMALRLYPEDDYAPFVAIDMANIFKESGDYKAAVGAHLKALNLPAVKGNPDMRREFDRSIAYLRRVDEVLSKHHVGGTPFSQIPTYLLREIDEGA